MISIKEIATQKELTDFVKFPLSLYKNNPYWVPPLISDEVASFSKDKNPVFQQAQAFFFLAYNEQKKIVGRVAAIINQNDLQQGIKKIRFGWLDMIDDLNVTKALIEKVAEKGREHQLDYMEGPMGFSSMDKVGLLTDGYDHIANMMTWYHYPYYKEHLSKLGFEKEKGFIDMSFLLENSKPELFKKTAEAIRKRYGVRLIDTPTTKEVLKHVDAMFDLYNEGKLFPFGFWHLLKAKKHHDTVEFYLIGVAPEYQSKGIPALLFDYYYNVFKRNGVTKCVITPELEENLAIQQLWKNFDPVIFARSGDLLKTCLAAVY